MRKMGRRLLESLAAALFPPRCVLCSGELAALEVVCSDCESSLPAFDGPRCQRCGEPVDDSSIDLCLRCGTQLLSVDRAFALGPYHGEWGRLVRFLKFEREMAVGRWLGKRMALALSAHDMDREFSVITYVPMTRRDRRKRGFNQAEVLARIIAKQLDLPMIGLLTKRHETPLQSKLSAAERRTNLRDAFRLLPCGQEQVLLVDDIFTTGSTVEECARTLKRGGAQSVVAMTVARA
ncbi:double zinc ribbon domain-containing protein [Candidatus Bipolaricaulota bacterium]